MQTADRYIDNISRTRQARKDAKPMRRNDWQADMLARRMMEGRRYDRKVYMGLNGG